MWMREWLIACGSHSHLASARVLHARLTGNRLNGLPFMQSRNTWLKPGVNETKTQMQINKVMTCRTSKLNTPYEILNLRWAIFTWSNYAKSKAPPFESSSGQTSRARCPAGTADERVSELPGAAAAASRVPEVRLLQGSRSSTSRTVGLTGEPSLSCASPQEAWAFAYRQGRP